MSDEDRQIIYAYSHLVQGFVTYDAAVNLCRTSEWWKRLAIAMIHKLQRLEKRLTAMQDNATETNLLMHQYAVCRLRAVLDPGIDGAEEKVRAAIKILDALRDSNLGVRF